MRLPTAISSAQDRLAGLLGCPPERRGELVGGMLARNTEEATSYWLQLTVAVGIATLGLVVGSTAVIIGAMLVAPLMGPILALGMGLASGSPFLVMRAAGRVLVSVLLSVGAAAGVTRVLPYLELNAEILGRTSPTLLDLVTAVFCALAGVYSALRPGSDTASTAAGTSIGISLVPPLCASGIGVGIGSREVAWGAGLLFVTNLVAIVVVATLAFALLGFQRAGARRLEREELSRGGRGVVARFVAGRIARSFSSTRGGAILRLLMPVVLLAGVFLPLRQGLSEVAWQVGARERVRGALAAVTLPVIETRTRVERGQIEVVAVIVGTTEDALGARDAILARLSSAGAAPRVDVMAVPDAATFAGLASELKKPPLPAPPPLPPPTAAETLSRARRELADRVRERWPADAAGPLLAVELEVAADSPTVRVTHLGAGLGGAATEGLSRSLVDVLGVPPRIVDEAIDPAPLEPGKDFWAFVSELTRRLSAARLAPGLSVCVVEPPARRERTTPADVEIRALLGAAQRVERRPGTEWSVRLSLEPCQPPAPPPDAPPEGP